MDSKSIRRVTPYRTVPQGINVSPTPIALRVKPLRLFFVAILATLMLPLFGSVAPLPVSAANSDPTAYPYKTATICQTNGTNCVADAWAFYERQCVSYVAWRINFNHNSTDLKATNPHFFTNTMFGSSDTARFGNAEHWDNAVTNAGNSPTNTWFYVDSVPAVGAAAVWDAYSTTGGVSGMGSAGHVAYVESVNANGSVNVSEYNYKGDSNYGTRSNTIADHYIHFNSPETGSVGSLKGNIYSSSSLLDLKPTLITATVSSSGINNTNFYYQKSYLGSYNLALPTGLVTLTATDGVSSFTVKNLLVPANGNSRLYNITLNNQCIDGTTGGQTSCTVPPFIGSANSGGGTVSGGVTGTGTVCTTAPTSSANVTGATQGNQGWWRSTTTVNLYANAPCGPNGLKTYYSINGGSQQTYSGPFTLNSEGIYNINFYSVDGLGNTEGGKSTQVKMDWTAPVTTGNATGPRDTNGIFRNDVNIGLNATDNLSGVDYEQRSVDGGTNWISQPGSNNTFLIKGSGVYRFLYRSADIAGNIEQSRDSGPIIINKYVIFSNNTSNSLRFLYGTGIKITGDIFTNGSTTIKSNTGSTFGTTFSTVGSANSISSNTNTVIPTIIKATSVPMLSYPLSLYQSLATVVFPSDLYLDTVGTSLNGIIYVQGNVTMYDVALSGSLSIVATGSITDYTTDSSFQTGDPHNGVLLYAGQNITLNDTGTRSLGMMYAPNGTITLSSTNLTLQGSLVADQIEINRATTLNLSYNPAFSSNTYSLPLIAMGLVAPTTPLPALPSVPKLSKPTNGSTLSTNASLSWGTSTGAVGYQLQVATSADFTTLKANISYLSTSAQVKLSAGTYYWRVRSINQAGTSAWSTIGNFKTK